MSCPEVFDRSRFGKALVEAWSSLRKTIWHLGPLRGCLAIVENFVMLFFIVGLQRVLSSMRERGTLHALPNQKRLRSFGLCPCLQGRLAIVGVFGMVFSLCPCLLGHLAIVGNFGMVFSIVGLSDMDSPL